ncbi:MAG: hypothetical protein RMJ56_17640 [Gemmataceae bacterium]|nr:hypothetical protein [Gemmata sp.]MDW8199421.1 hypothetical protein [Gemmataceae bacterium]
MFQRLWRRWATVVAVLAVVAPTPAYADIQILVEELDAGSNVVGSSSFFVGSPSGSTTFFQPFSYSSTNGHFTLSGFAGTNSNLGLANASLSTSFTGGFTSQFDASQRHMLRITITDDRYTAGSLPYLLTNSAGVAVGFSGGSIQVNSFSRVIDPTDPTAIPASSTTQLADGPTIGTPTPVATDSLPAGDPSLRITRSLLGALPTPYGIQQVIILSFEQTGTIDPGSTFTGSAGVRADPVPAPGGLVLALVALPMLGWRRWRQRGTV